MNETGIAVFPNPTKNTLEIQNNTHQKIESVEIINLVGKVQERFEVSTTTEPMDISGLATGIYLIRFQTSVGVFSDYLIKL